ncbi:uncharacterized protein SPSC_06473 [Sporisorium scitamineum]|uniref:Uncharacterized protein n=1 Tax=Sporisorium scitamineum TaxID=49012 RepID=A0A0F7S3E9_9BASI|nr:hypothetical protein [Sporisorium scitamineum]CDU26279.1 uncharacterized protein SPSC_06473 [Sporisorium scitamineum]
MSSSPPATRAGSSSFSTRTRICKKLVIKGHASSSGASYTLFSKIQVPTTETNETYLLFTDPHVELQDAIVHRLDTAGAAPALSTSAATAANSLGIPLSIDHEMNDSFIDHEPRQTAKSNAQTGPKSDTSNLPTVIQTDDGKVTLRTSFRSSPRSKRAVSLQQPSTSYMVTLHLFAKPLSKPPFAPFSVRLAVPVCLNNFMRFTVDESMDSDFGLQGMAVEVDPPILPVSSQRKPPRRRFSAASSHRAPSIASFSDDEADVTLLGSNSVDESDLEQDDTAIVGPFHACDALVVRIAAQQAGDLIDADHPLRILPNALRAKRALSSITYKPRVLQGSEFSVQAMQSSSSDTTTTTKLDFEASLDLFEPYFPGLDREVQLYVQLDPNVSILEWRSNTVDASRGIVSWCFGPVASSTPSPNQVPRSTAQGVLSGSPTFEIGDLVVLPDPNQHSTEEENLLSVAPPKGINDADFDFSMDNAAAPSTKQRRFSLQSSVSAKNVPSVPPSEPSDSSSGSEHMLVVTFSLLPLLQSTEPVSLCIRGTLMLDDALARAAQSGDVANLPRGLFSPAAQNHAYETVRLAAIEPAQGQSEAAPLHAESLDDSRETVQQVQQQEKTKLMLQGLNAEASGGKNVDDILRQALAIIAAHNESLSTSHRNANALERHDPRLAREGRDGGINWILRASHLLWTLFLTALIFMLFNAGQTANRTLSAKLDELSRIVEASTKANSHTFYSAAQKPDPVPEVFEPIIPASPSLSDDEGPTLPVDDVLGKAQGSPHAETLPEPNDAAKARSFWTESFSSKNSQTGTREAQLSYFVSNWLQDMLRMPIVFIRSLLSIFIAA